MISFFHGGTGSGGVMFHEALLLRAQTQRNILERRTMAREIFEELKDWIFWLLGNGKIKERDKTKTYGGKRGRDIHDFYNMLEAARLRKSLCKNLFFSKEIKIFKPPSNFACS